LDRGNLSNALTDGLLADLGLSSNDYNNGTTIQVLSFLCAEFPVQILTKRYGFRRVLPILMMMWSTVSWAQAFMHNRTGFYITRALIGACEGGFSKLRLMFQAFDDSSVFY
jgi:MFS family permease